MADDDMRPALSIYKKYHNHYDGEVQGCCPLIADEICRAVGGEVVAGEIVFYGSVRRTHWWVEKDGVTLDPMGDALMDPRDFPERVEIHRDRTIFDAILPQYERWRVANDPSAAIPHTPPIRGKEP
jgi:hypothetical protein